MKRPRLTLSLFNPRRRLRDRLLAAMLVVALVPAAAFFVLTAIDLHGITQTTINGAVNGLVKNQENTFQTELVGTASTEINGNLQALQVKVAGLAAALATATAKVAAPTPSPGAAGAGTSGSPTAKANPTATSSPTVTASPAPSVNPAPTSTPAATNDLAYSEVGDGVWEVTNFSSPAAELLVGTTSGSESVQTRAEQLANLSGFADKQLADVAKVGSSVDAVWIIDQTDNAVWVSPGDVPVPQVQGLASNPRGNPTSLPIGLGSPTPPPQTPAAAIQAVWTVPYKNLLQGNRLVVTVYAQVGEGLVVGADVPLAQFASQISDAPSETGSYPLLLGHSSSSWNQVIAGSGTGKDFTGRLPVGGQLPRPGGKDGSNLLAALRAAESGAAGIPPIDETVGGVERLFFVAPVTTLSSDGWILVDSAPKANFEPNKNALSLAISQKLNSIVQGAIWIVVLLLLVSFVLATVLSRFVVAPVRALTASAERLAEGHTDENVAPQGRDEVGDLADSLERMRREINASR